MTKSTIYNDDLWSAYNTLWSYLRELRRFVMMPNETTPFQRFKIYQEIGVINAEVKRMEKRLKIEVTGDWEFSELAQGKDLSKTVPMLKSAVDHRLSEIKRVALEDRIRRQWEEIKADPVRHEKRKESKRFAYSLKKK